MIRTRTVFWSPKISTAFWKIEEKFSSHIGTSSQKTGLYTRRGIRFSATIDKKSNPVCPSSHEDLIFSKTDSCLVKQNIFNFFRSKMKPYHLIWRPLLWELVPTVKKNFCYFPKNIFRSAELCRSSDVGRRSKSSIQPNRFIKPWILHWALVKT